jgi:hypothetical protein
MALPPITHFEPDPACLAVIEQCTDSFDVGDDDAEWPNNMISRHAVAYSHGAIARKGEAPAFKVDPEELATCQRLAHEALALMEGQYVGMGSETDSQFRAFFIVANVDDPPAPRITESLVRVKFGGTVFPPATMVIEPLEELGKWWAEVARTARQFAQAGEGDEQQYLRPWQAMIKWFRTRSEFVDTAFVSIGEVMALADLSEDDYPPGTEMPPSVLPRAALGLTKNGSLAGIFGVTMQT